MTHLFPNRPLIRRLLVVLTIAALVRIALFPLNPVNDVLQRVSLLGAIGIGWLGALILGWRRRGWRWFWIGFPCVAAVAVLLPGRRIDEAELRADYVRRLADFEGTNYVWGGEGRRGIDCSGLPRRAWRDALRSYGIRHLDGGALRAAVAQWWYDTSARALAAGYRDFTRPLGQAGILRKMDFSQVLPGDLAVTRDGVHVMAYAGAERWIEADPGAGRVITLNARTSESGWLDVPVSLHRWNLPL
jgi:hypothetical protein